VGFLEKLTSYLILIPVLPYALFLGLEQVYLGVSPVGALPLQGLGLSEKLLTHLYLFFQYGF
jgi:hypothetical protein